MNSDSENTSHFKMCEIQRRKCSQQLDSQKKKKVEGGDKKNYLTHLLVVVGQQKHSVQPHFWVASLVRYLQQTQ